MLLVSRQVGLAVLFQPEIEGALLMTSEATVRVHIGLSAVPYLALEATKTMPPTIERTVVTIQSVTYSYTILRHQPRSTHHLIALLLARRHLPFFL